MTGCLPGPLGRNTSARNATPSSMAIGASQSTCMPSALPLVSFTCPPSKFLFGTAVRQADRLASVPVTPARADHDHDQAERQVDGDDLADEVETAAGARPVRGIDRTLARQPRSVEQPEEQRDHHPADRLHEMDMHADRGKAAEGLE